MYMVEINFLIKNNGVISKWIKSILKNKPLLLDNKGSCIRDFVYIDDIIKIFEKLISIKKKKKISIYNVGSGEKISLNYLLNILKKIIQKKNKKKLNLKIINRELDNSQIEYSFSSNKKIKKALNFEFTNLEKGISKIIQNFSKLKLCIILKIIYSHLFIL